MSASQHSPLATIMRARASLRPPAVTFTARIGRSSRSGSSAASVSVPGVTSRITFLSTGPFEVAGSPSCSQIATDSPIFTSRARYCSAA